MGVPQGSHLGPKLINEILESNQSYYSSFADDICVLIRDSAAYKFSLAAQALLTKIEHWANNAGLEFSKHKCKFTIFKTRIPQIKPGGSPKKFNKELTYLDVVYIALSSFDKLLN